MPPLITRLNWKTLRIPFKAAFRHASAERSETTSVWVEAVSCHGISGYGESCPRAYVTGETLDTARDFFLQHQAGLCAAITSLSALRDWVAVHVGEIDANPAAWCAIELAVLDLLAQENGQSIEALLSLPPLQGCFRYTAVLGDADPASFAASVEQYRRYGFTDFKLKLCGDLRRDREKLAVFKIWGDQAARIRIDANNLWQDTDDALHFLRALDSPFFAIEEPIHANQYTELARIGDALNCKIILDESCLRLAQLDVLRDAPTRWLINVRVSKMGGLLRSLAMVEAAQAMGIRLIVGAQVGETSMLTRAALTVAYAARDALVAQEGAFGTFLLQRDVCNPPLMFGEDGILDTSSYPCLQASGTGLILDESFIMTTTSKW